MRGLIYVQPYFWLYFFNELSNIKDRDNLKIGFYFCTAFVYFMLLDTGFSFSQYSNKILRMYVLFVYISYYYLREKYDVKDSICLAFLIVFINSYYWEMMLHINKIIFFGLDFNDVIQMLHLIPAYLLYRRLIIKDRVKFKRVLLIGLIAGCFNVMAIGFLKYPFGFRFYFNLFNRVICLSILNYILVSLVDIQKNHIIIEGDMIFEGHKTV